MTHLIYLCDGTWMFPGQDNVDAHFTNIHNLNNYLGFNDSHNFEPQVTFYFRGLGSGYRLSKLVRGMTGRGIWNAIEEVYLNICANFDPKIVPKIYLFGYSRGAITARVVAGLVDIGILKPENFDYLPVVRSLYLLKVKQYLVGHLSPKECADIEKFQEQVNDGCYKNEPKIKIEFMGLFDSVIGGSKINRRFQELGVVASRPAQSVKKTFQIMSLDETRPMFAPSWFKFPSDEPSHLLEQVWLPGTHADIGGGQVNNLVSRFSLLLMIDRILKHTNLSISYQTQLAIFEAETKPIFEISNERTAFWKATSFGKSLKRIPAGHQSSVHPLADYLAYTPHRYKGSRLLRTRSRPELSSFPRSTVFESGQFQQSPCYERFVSHPSSTPK